MKKMKEAPAKTPMAGAAVKESAEAGCACCEKIKQ
jgi:hypothetical protein